jgi:hypothetical protein
MRVASKRKSFTVVCAIAVCCLLAVAGAEAQSKKSAKQADNLEKAGESAKASVQDLLGHLGKMLAGYNSIVSGEAKNPQSAYKKLVGDLKSTDKKISAANKELSTMNKQADSFFKAWEQDLEEISSDSLREKSAKRLELARERYASLGETLTQARQEFAPVVQNMNDQILFLGRDLSPGAIADLQDEAEELNRQADDLKTKVEGMLQAAAKTQDQAEAAIEGD